MGHLLFHRRAVAQTHTRALSYVLYLSLLWFGVVWSDLHEDGLVSCWIELVALLPDCLASSQKSAVYSPLLCLSCAGCFIEQAASHTHHFSAVVVAVLAHLNTLPRTSCDADVVLHAELSALMSHFREVLNFSRRDDF